MVFIFEDVQEGINVFVEMHGGVEKPIVAISFENFLRTEEIERGQQTLMEETCLYVLFRQEETYFHGCHDLVACYMEYSTNQNLRLR
jgi:hypothetical protein